MEQDRREFVKTTIKAGMSVSLAPAFLLSDVQKNTVQILNPRNRVPVSLIIDDSTCLVNLAHFGIPQFAEVFPENYKQDWRKLPREILIIQFK